MNNWNPTEQQLRSWTPRSPSAKLKNRLFPAEDALDATDLAGRWAWLTPVMGCFLAMLVISGSRNNQGDYFSVPPTNWLAAAASNQSYAAYIAAGFHSEQNSPQQDPIEWTTSTSALDEVHPASSRATNSLIRN
jgi:hypothetical protein